MRIVCDNAHHDADQGVCTFCVQARIDAAVAKEREWCAQLVECPAATHLEMVAIYEKEGKDPKVFRTQANALIEAAKAIRESGRFRAAIEAKKAGHIS